MGITLICKGSKTSMTCFFSRSCISHQNNVDFKAYHLRNKTQNIYPNFGFFGFIFFSYGDTAARGAFKAGVH